MAALSPHRKTRRLTPVSGPTSLHTDRHSTSYLCQDRPLQTLTESAPYTCARPPQAETEPASTHTCARPRLFKHQQTQPLVRVPSPPPWTLTDQNLILVRGPASWDTDRPSTTYLCHMLHPQTISSKVSYLGLVLPLLKLTDPSTSYLGPFLTPQAGLTNPVPHTCASLPLGTLTGPMVHTWASLIFSASAPRHTEAYYSHCAFSCHLVDSTLYHQKPQNSIHIFQLYREHLPHS